MKTDRKPNRQRISDKAEQSIRPSKPTSSSRKLAEETIRFQADLLANINDAVIASDNNNRIITWNAAAERMYGWQAEEALGQTATEIVKTEIDAASRAEVLGILAETGRWRGDVTQARKDGSRFHVETASITLRDTQGKITGYASVNRDITERKQADKAHAQLAAIVDSSDDAIIGKTLDGIITSWNAGAQYLYGYTAEEAIGQSVSFLIPSDRPDELPEILTKLHRGESINHFETERQRKDGSRLLVSLTISPIKDARGHLIGASTVARDITERKQAEEKIQRQNQRLFILREIDMAILAADSVEDIVRAALDYILVLLGCQRAGVALIDWAKNEAVNFDVRTSKETALAQGARVPLALIRDTIQILLQNQPILVNDLTVLPNPPTQIQTVIQEGIRAVYILPLFAQDTLIGTFSMSSMEPGFFGEEKMDLGREVANQLALALAQSRMAETLRESEQLFSKIFTASPVAISMISLPDGKNVEVNDAWCALTGFSKEEAIGHDTGELNIFDQAERDKLIKEFSIHGRSKLLESEITAKSGEKKNVLINSELITIKENKLILTSVIDVSERHLAEQKIERQNQRLSVLREIDTAILAANSVESIVGVALSHVRELIDCRRANLTLIDWETNESVIFDVSTISETAIPRGRRFPLAQYQDVIQALAQNQLLVMNDLRALADPRPAIQSLLTDGLQSLCSLPLSSQGKLLGMFSMYSEMPNYFDEEKIGLGREVANQVALAITQKNLLEGLRDQQARTAGIINSAMDAIISVDTDQRIVLFNPAAEAMFQCGQAEAVGQPMEQFLPERFRQRHLKHIQHFAETGVTSRAMGQLGTIYGLRRNGEEFPIEASISQTQVAGKSIFTVILRDITVRKRAEETLRQSQENFAKAFNANPAAIAITRLVDGKFLNVNPAYLRIMGYEPDELLGYTAAEKNIYAYPEERAQLVQQLQAEGSVQNYELRVRVKSGETHNIILSMQPILYNEEECILTVFIDISERKKMEAELQRSNSELEQFAYVASHDLQEPLRAVAGMVQLLGQRYKGKLDERADEYIGHAVEASGRMQSLINDLLDYSRVDRLGKPFSATNLERTLDLALANLQVAIQESGAQITRDPLPTLTADAGQLTQVFQNLIGNAIKFKGERTPQIHVGAEKLENGWRFTVRDNGIGIEAQYFERIFLVFQRLHTRREYSGTGIGLALCKKIVERHHGQLWVESQSEQGSTFYFTIPER